MAVPACSVVIPAFNEAQGIASVVQDVRRMLQDGELESEVIVVDDGSTDGTGEAATEAGAKVVAHEQNLGYGAALTTGIRRAKHEIVVILDADGTYPSDRIPDLLERMPEFDMVVGARTSAGAQIPWVRRPAKWLLGRFANYVAGMKIPDLNSGMRAFRRTAAIAISPMLPRGFSWTTTITLATLVEGGSISYVPIKYSKRTGRSKIRPIRDTLNFFVLVSRLALYFRPMRVFFPLGMLCTVVSVGKLVYDAFVYSFSLRGTTVAALVLTAQVWLLGLVADLVVAQRRLR